MSGEVNGVDESQSEETMGEEEDEEEGLELPVLSQATASTAGHVIQPSQGHLVVAPMAAVPGPGTGEEMASNANRSNKHVNIPNPPSQSPPSALQNPPGLTPISPVGAVGLVTSHSLTPNAANSVPHLIQLAPGHMPPQNPQPTPPKLTPHEISLITEAASKPGPNGTFQCTLCNKQFGYKNGLIRHIRLTHVGEKPYECNICHRRFGYKHILMEHQNLHYGHRPYACTQCDKKFAARSNLIQHRSVHKRPYVCSLCNKRFDKEDQLKKHLFAHPQALLSCTLCKYAAPNQNDLNKHIMEAHAAILQEGLKRNGAPLELIGLINHGGGIAAQTSVSPRGGIQAEAIAPRQTEPVSPPDGETSPQDLSATCSDGAGSPPSQVVRPQVPGHRIDAICSQLSTSVANITPNTVAGFSHGLIIKKEVADFEDGVINGQREQNAHLPVGMVTAIPASSGYVPISPTDSNDSKSSQLPGIQEMFSRRTPNVPMNLPTNIAVSALALAAEQNRMHPDLHTVLMSPPPVNSSLAPSSASAVVTAALIQQRPTAQLPPITQLHQNALHRKDQGMQHTAAINGFPSLDDVLGYYMGQGKLFKCQYCNILFFERGMYFLHASLHGTSSPWECSICHKICSDKNEFTIHFVNQQHNQ